MNHPPSGVRRALSRRRSRAAVLLGGIGMTTVLAACGGTVGGSALGIASSAAPATSAGGGTTSSASTGTSGTAGSVTAGTPTTESSAAEPTTDSTSKSTAASSSRATAATTSAGPATTRTSFLLPDPKEDRPRNEYGDIEAALGQSYGVFYTDPDGSDGGRLIFLVTKINVDPQCEPNTPTSKHGHLVRLTIKVERRNLTEASLERFSQSFGPGAWTVFDAEGRAQVDVDSDASYGCVGGKSTTDIDVDTLRQVQVITRSVAFDTSLTQGTLLLDLGVDGGWEYSFG